MLPSANVPGFSSAGSAMEASAQADVSMFDVFAEALSLRRLP
jgi:hypothetical protein